MRASTRTPCSTARSGGRGLCSRRRRPSASTCETQRLVLETLGKGLLSFHRWWGNDRGTRSGEEPRETLVQSSQRSSLRQPQQTYTSVLKKCTMLQVPTPDWTLARAPRRARRARTLSRAASCRPPRPRPNSRARRRARREGRASRRSSSEASGGRRRRTRGGSGGAR